MPVFLAGANALDFFNCACCGRRTPKAGIHEHHLIKQASGGQDDHENIVSIDSYCHTAIHQIESALKNKKRLAQVPDLLRAFFPDNEAARKLCLEYATKAARGVGVVPDYSIFDEDDAVYLTPPKVHPQTREQAKIVAKEVKNPRTGRSIGVSGYLKMLLEHDLRKRGFKVIE